jgi:HEAT repeat protein
MAPLPDSLAASSAKTGRRGLGASFRFNLRELLIVTMLVAVLFAWWRDHREQANRHLVYQEQIHRLTKRRYYFAPVTIPLTLAPGAPGESYQGEYSPATTNSATAYFASTVAAERGVRESLDENASVSSTDFLASLRRGTDAEFQSSLAHYCSHVDLQSLDELLPLLSDTRPFVRQRTLLTLSCTRQHPERAIPAMTPLLADPDLKTAQTAIDAIGSYAHLATEAMPALVAIMQQDDSPLAVHAALAVNQVDYRLDIGPRLAELLSSPHDFVRARAIRELGQHAERDLVEAALVGAYGREPNPTLKLAILDTLNDLDR